MVLRWVSEDDDVIKRATVFRWNRAIGEVLWDSVSHVDEETGVYHGDVVTALHVPIEYGEIVIRTLVIALKIYNKNIVKFVYNRVIFLQNVH